MRRRLTRDAVGAFGLRVCGLGLNFLLSLLLARLLGAGEYGSYAFAVSLAGLVGVPALMGMDKLLMRQSAIYVAQAEWGLLRGLLRRANQAALVLALGLGLVAGGVVWWTPHMIGITPPQTVWLALGLLPALSLTRLRQAVLRGLHQAARAQLPEMVTQPAVFVLLLLCLWRFGELAPTATSALALNLLASTGAFIHGAILLRKAFPQPVRASSHAYRTDDWLRGALPLMALGCVQAFNAQIDLLLIGVLLSPEQTGLYAVALKGAALVAIVAEVVNTVLAPAVASLHASGESGRLQRMMARSTRSVFLLSLPAGLVLTVFAERFLALFGAEFVGGATALAILSIGQVSCMTMGSAGLLLTMTGHERDTAGAFALGALSNLALILLFAPRWGINGVAFGKGLSLVALHLFLTWRVRRRLGFYATALN